MDRLSIAVQNLAKDTVFGPCCRLCQVDAPLSDRRGKFLNNERFKYNERYTEWGNPMVLIEQGLVVNWVMLARKTKVLRANQCEC